MPRHVEIRPLEERHLGFVVALHAASLPHGLFVQLGPGWLRAYYRTFVTSPYGVALVALQDGQPVGMLVGATRSRDHRIWVRRACGLRLAARAAGALAVRPWTVALLVRTRGRRLWLRLRGQASATPNLAGPATRAVLTYLSVARPVRGQGVGAALVERFLDEARRAGAGTALLVAPGGPTGASGFYRRLGWTFVADQRSRDGWPVSVFVRPLDPLTDAT
jgi:ribosomal protein S18 acetylase RimI-like enzyme